MMADEMDENKDFVSREYQDELADMAIEKNLIIYLPTGSGKTFIATTVIKHFCKSSDALKRPINDGGKRAFFLVNTVALVHQQVSQIRKQAPYVVEGYTGDMGVDFWDIPTWHAELGEKAIIVMTAQIFLNLILQNVITLKNAFVLVFDECHHGVNDHPMRQIMQRFQDIQSDQWPRVVGLTATLINRNLKVNQVEAELRTLESTYLSKIATATNERMVRLYSTNPKECKVNYVKHSKDSSCYLYRERLFQNIKTEMNMLKIDDEEPPTYEIKPYGTKQIDSRGKKTNKELKNILEDIESNMDDLGVYGGIIALTSRMVQMQRLILHCQSETAKAAYDVINTALLFLRRSIDTEIKGKARSQLEGIKMFLSDKVLKFLSILRKLKEGDIAIVFVKRRFTAKIMHKIISKIAELDPTLNHIKCDFIVGYNVTNPFKDTRENMVQRHYNSRVMEKFKNGLLNVMFGSNVVEEGVDIPTCNMIVMFDQPMDFRSYVQSKGRARDPNSHYIIMTCDPSFLQKYNTFREVEDKLREHLCGGKWAKRSPPSNEEQSALFDNIPGLEPYKPQGNDGPKITATSAISHINRYFASLKVDRFTNVTPYWFIEEKNNKYRCYLHLPMESRVRGRIEGSWQSNKENAKRSVALEACKKLHQSGELDDDHLLPISNDVMENVDNSYFMPNKDDSEVFEEIDDDGKCIRLGTKSHKRRYEKKWPDCLSECRPKPSEKVFLHILEVKPIYKPPSYSENHRLAVFHNILSDSVGFAIVSTKQLPLLAPFPLFMSTGELEVNVKKAVQVQLDKSELDKISKFQGILFEKIIGIGKPFLSRDFSNSHNAYLIAPVIFGGEGVTIDWDVIERSNKPFPIPEAKPTEEKRKSLVVNDDNYLGMIVTPWYRTVPAQNYIVTKVCYDMSEESIFPSSNYPTYKDYFADKYNIKTCLKNQPLLEVRAISSRLNNIKPMAKTKALKRKNKDENEDFEVWLLPELCFVYPVPGRYWMKALLLPSVIHRVNLLCMAEELRIKIWAHTKIGVKQLQKGERWEKLKGDPSLVKITEEKAQPWIPITSLLKSECKIEGCSIFKDDEVPLDIDRAMDDDVTLFDILIYNKFVDAPLVENKGKIDIKTPHIQQQSFVEPPPLKMIQKTPSDMGPQQVKMLQAITVAVANDLINCERLETLGDSYLKFAISLVLFERQEDWLEGHLTSLKGQIVGNKNLYFCGRQKNLGSILEVSDFSPREEWVPPGFCVDPMIQNVIVSAQLDPSVLYKINIPEKERAAGIISKDTETRIGDILMNETEDLKQVHTCCLINQQALTDKNIADAVEAILGTYLESSGVLGCLRVMNWFGVINPSLSTPEVFTDKLTDPVKGMRGSPMEHLFESDILQRILNYKFQNKAYLLQALTHPSYTRNNITQSYQRLEFLGDAIIDFLITVHIFEQCTELHPGDLTDLRSALVNNITLGCIAVRNHFHKFLLHRSSALNDCMMRFVRHQEDRNHLIDSDILFLCEEGEVNIGESIEVPKALGDLVESLIGAIYLDCGKNLNTTWKIVYNLFRTEIEKFSKDVPKNPVRLLYETGTTPVFKPTIAKDGVVSVRVEFELNDVLLNADGFGDTKKQAKRAAAKIALRKIQATLSQPTK